MVNSLAVSSLYSICDSILDAGLLLTRKDAPVRCNDRMRILCGLDDDEKILEFHEALMGISMQPVVLEAPGMLDDERMFSVRTGTLDIRGDVRMTVTAVKGLDDAEHCLYLIYHGTELSAILSEELLKGEHYDFFVQLFKRSPIATALLDNDDRVIQANESFQKLFGYTEEEAEGSYINDLIAYGPEVRTEAEALSSNSVAGDTVRRESARYCKDGTVIPVDILAYPVMSRDHKVAVYAMYTDIRERKAFENHMRLYQNVLEGSTEGICILDPAGRMYWNNQAFLKMTGRENIPLEGQTLASLNVLNGHVLDFLFGQILRNNNWTGEAVAYREDGLRFPVLINGYSMLGTDSSVQHYILFFNDITDYKQREERLSFLSSKDSLTELTNRTTFLDSLRDWLFCASFGDEFAVLYIDLDDFKLINDSISHSAGDEVLKYIGNLLKSCLRDTDLLSRYGGDEFAIVLRDKNVQELTVSVCDRIYQKLKMPIELNDLEITLGASIGVAFYPQDGMDSGTLVRHAEIAMYRAKREQKNSVQTYRDDMKGYYHEQYYLRNALWSALRNREIFLAYQPVVNAETEKIAGFEALCRWEHPKLGPVPPSQFIPLAESNGFIIEMGEWVLREACRQLKEWQQTGHEELFVAVNISVRQLEAPGFTERVASILRETALDPKYLELEITESIQMQQNTLDSEVLDHLKKLGVSIVMDDFGTGYSSLAQLTQMPLSKLKIDRSFVEDCERNRLLIQAIVAMAGSLDLQIVAEGVERQDQLESVISSQCHYVQGYYYSKPLSSGDIPEFLTQQNPLKE